MGSCSKGSRMEAFVEAFAPAFQSHYAHLIGTTIVDLDDVTVDYHVKGTVKLSNHQSYPVHYRWSTEEEDAEGAELDENYASMLEFYESNMIGHPITAVELGTSIDMNDELYLVAYVRDSKCLCLEIPVGYDPEHHSVDSVTLDIIGRDAWLNFSSEPDDNSETH